MHSKKMLCFFFSMAIMGPNEYMDPNINKLNCCVGFFSKIVTKLGLLIFNPKLSPTQLVLCGYKQRFTGNSIIPIEFKTPSQVYLRLGKLWFKSSYVKHFKVLCHILGGMGKS